MMEVNIYQIQKTFFHKTFGNFITKLHDLENCSLCIVCEDDSQVKEIDDLLWTFAQLSFLPHATYADNIKQSEVPILITKGANIEGRVPVFMSLSLANKDQHEKMFVVDAEFQDVDSLRSRFAKDKLNHKIFRQDQSGKWLNMSEK
jgi:DNA polymerase IIIc chi subunit